MYAAIAGLRTHMQKLNVIGNNIANVNTYGYKSGRAVFETSLYTSIRGGSNGTATVGGTNPSQIGYGSALGSVDVDMSTSNFALTGKSTDCMIDGDGFFLVGNKELCLNFDATDATSYKSLTLSRVGDFDFKADGYLTDRHGSVVYGFMCTGIGPDGKTPIVSDQLVPLRLPKMETKYMSEDGTVLDPVKDADKIWEGTDKKELKDGVKEVKSAVYATTEKANDAAGGAGGAGGGTITGTGEYTGLLRDGTDSAGNDLPYAKLDSITIDGTTGKITGIMKDSLEQVTIGYIAIGSVTNPNGVTQISNTYYQANEGSGDLNITMLGGVASQVYNAANKENYEPLDATKGAPKPDGIKNTDASRLDDPTKAVDATEILSAGTTSLITNGLEASKTDLANEIAEMITTQRGYQANTRIVTVTDQMLEELVNMKR